MSRYSYSHQAQKQSGVQFPAMVAQKNNQKYKLLSAEDIAWDVTINQGTEKEVAIEDTDDLLDYISGLQNYVEDVTEDVVQKVFSTYKIECDISVCYAGDVFDHNPDINVYKIVEGRYVRMPYRQVIESGINPTLTSTSSSNIIQYDETGQYLNGTAVAGTNTLTLIKDEEVIASYQITILNRPERVFSTVIYTESETQPNKPIGGSCDENFNFTPPIGWTTDASTLNNNNTIWFSIGTIFSNNNSATWSNPCMYITKEAVQNTDKNYSNGVAVYKTVSTVDSVSTPDNTDGSYNFSTGEITAPDGWYNSPQLSIESYIKTIDDLITANPDMSNSYESMKDSYKIYVSFNSYTASYNGSIYFDVKSTGWTTPVEYLNMDNAIDVDMIARAIYAKDLNINNTTYLFGNGDVWFAQGADKRGSKFNHDGSGHLAGGLISWENTGDLNVEGKIIATSGEIGDGDHPWYIGAVKGVPAIYAIDEDNYRLSLTTQYLEGGKNENPSWRILRDGTATFANGNVVFNNNGSGYIGVHDNTTGETKGLTISDKGDVTLEGINVTINASGIADLTSTIKNTVTGDTEVVGVIANAAAGQVNVLGRLKTEDVEVGNGACFFKGSSEATDVPKYGEDEQGSGFVANGNIKWDKYGNINIGSVGGTCNQELTDIKLKKRGVLVPANRLSTVAEDYENNINDYVSGRPLGHYDMSEYIYISEEDYNNAIQAEDTEIRTSVLTQSQYYKLSSDERTSYIGLPVYGDYVYHTCKQKGFYICTKKQNESTLIYLDYQDGSFPRVTSMAELRRQIRIRQIGQGYIRLLVTDSTDDKQYPCYMIGEDDTTNEGYDKDDYLQDVLGKEFPIYVHNVPWADGPTSYNDGNVISIEEGEDGFNTYFKKAYDVGSTVYNLDYLMYTDSTHNDGIDTGLVYLGDTTQEQSIKFAINATGREEGNAPGRKTSVGNILHFKSGVYYGGFSTDKYGENSRSYNIDMFFGEVRNANLNDILYSSYKQSDVVDNVLKQYETYNGPMMICPLAMPNGGNPNMNGYDGGTNAGYSIMAPGIFGAIHVVQQGDPDRPVTTDHWVFTGFFNGQYYRKG